MVCTCVWEFFGALLTRGNLFFVNFTAMKKVVLSIIALVYFFAVTGWEINIHYCMGHVDSVSLLSVKKDTCDTCGMSRSDNNGCCHDENQFVRLAQDQKLTSSFHYKITAPVTESLTNQSTYTISSAIPFNPSSSISELDLPPPSNPLFIRNRVFRI